MGKGRSLAGLVVTALMLYSVYLILSGGFKPVDLVFGAVSAAAVAALTADLLVSESSKLSPRRLAYLIAYLVKYFLIYEVKAHVDVARRALSPSMPLKPGIVEVPHNLRSDFAVLMLANSITNTPGTVTVAVDERGRRLYVHWIYVRSVKPEECRELITKEFERFARKVFD